MAPFSGPCRIEHRTRFLVRAAVISTADSRQNTRTLAMAGDSTLSLDSKEISWLLSPLAAQCFPRQPLDPPIRCGHLFIFLSLSLSLLLTLSLPPSLSLLLTHCLSPRRRSARTLCRSWRTRACRSSTGCWWAWWTSSSPTLPSPIRFFSSHHPHALSLFLTRTRTLSHSHTHSLSLSFTRILSLSLTRAHAHSYWYDGRYIRRRCPAR